ncbi:hypothetical protein M9H77_28318 [Catharanthus roseus]|uniref:Uncharacterized protein n=1 Tax=Catharanthus roseus TaxID=4058 RepID=A0ACC0AGX2_CATRO|nr:hypothetical protein M9H77_28318 [Catharanthus roseus]
MFAPPVRAGARLCKPYVLRFAMLDHKIENKLIDLRIRLDMMTADEVRWTPYRSNEITDIWVSTYHGMIAYFDCVEPYMPDRVVRQFGGTLAGGTISSAYVYMDQYPCYTSISVHRLLHALVFPCHSSTDSESGQAPPRRAIADHCSYYTAGSIGYGSS